MEKVITILGLGAGDLSQLPLGIYRQLQKETKIFVRTIDHPVLRELEEEGFTFISFDEIYEAHDSFEEVYHQICTRLVQEVQASPITYAVPGHPLVAEYTIQLLLERERNGEISTKILGGQSFLDPMFSTLKIDPIEGFQLLDGSNLKRETVQIRNHIIIGQVYDQFSASEVKLTLMDLYPDDYEVTIITAAGSKEEKLESVPLYELDRVTTLSNLTAIYVPPVQDDTGLYGDFEILRKVFAELRGPNGCPWDKKQTHESLKKYLLEEAYEVLEAIDEKDDIHLVEELGDVLLQVMLHAQIGEDNGLFTIRDIIYGLTEKMVRRHPHVFGNAEVHDSDKVVAQWEDIKKQEKGAVGESFHSILSGVPISLPSLLKAYKIQKKAAKVGFDWGEEAPMWMKLQEEISEWIQEMKAGKHEAASKELGDVLFSFVNLARFHGIDPEEALRQTNQKFTRRFQYIEKTLFERGEKLEDQTLELLDSLWEQAKKEE